MEVEACFSNESMFEEIQIDCKEEKKQYFTFEELENIPYHVQ